MNYTIQEIPGEDKPFKILDASGKQIAESTALDKAQRFIFYRQQAEKAKT